MKTSVNILLSAMLLFSGGCATQSLLPTQGIYTESPFETYNQVESVVNKIKISVIIVFLIILKISPFDLKVLNLVHFQLNFL